MGTATSARLRRRAGDTPVGTADPRCDQQQTRLGQPARTSTTGAAWAEATLMVAEALHRHAVAQTDELTAAALEQYELRKREERVAVGAALADGVSKALKAVEFEPRGGWFAGEKREKVRALAVR